LTVEAKLVVHLNLSLLWREPCIAASTSIGTGVKLDVCIGRGTGWKLNGRCWMIGVSGGWGSPPALEEGIIPLDRFVNEVIETLKVMWCVEFVFDTSFRPSK